MYIMLIHWGNVVDLMWASCPWAYIWCDSPICQAILCQRQSVLTYSFGSFLYSAKVWLHVGLGLESSFTPHTWRVLQILDGMWYELGSSLLLVHIDNVWISSVLQISSPMTMLFRPIVIVKSDFTFVYKLAPCSSKLPEYKLTSLFISLQ